MTIFEVLQREINDKVGMILDRLGGGQVSDYADYRYHCGILYGLYSLRTYIEELKRNLEDEE